MEVLYIQNFEKGMLDSQLMHLIKVGRHGVHPGHKFALHFNVHLTHATLGAQIRKNMGLKCRREFPSIASGLESFCKLLE